MRIQIFKPVCVLIALVGCFMGTAALSQSAASANVPAKATPRAISSTSTSTPAPEYKMTELQRAHLHEAQLQFFLANDGLQTALANFNAVCGQIKTENKWSDDVKCDLQKAGIVPPAAKAEAKTPKSP